MTPSIGRIVHFGYVRRWIPPAGAAVEHQDSVVECAAIITKVWWDETVNLHIFLPDGEGAFGKVEVEHSKELKEGCWSWPIRE